MSAVRVPDVLVRVSPTMLQRYNSLAVLGAGRGRVVPLPYTFTRGDATTCARRFDRDGLSQLVAANIPRIEMVDLDGDGVRETAGLLLEGTRMNVVLHNRDLTNAAWVKTNVSAVKDQTGIDGVASSASRITASAGNGTCLQAITLASSARYQSAYVKRLVGTGTIEMTMDNGATWTAIVPTVAWTLVTIPTQTLADPTVGFRIVTNTDSIAVDLVQNENGVFPSSPIATTTVAVVRAADSLTISFNFGPLDLTLLARMARPAYTDVSGSLGGSGPGIFNLSTVTARHGLFFANSTRMIQTFMQDVAGASRAIPSGNEVAVAVQFDASPAQSRLDVGDGNGYTSFTSATGFSFGNQALRLGAIDTELYGVLNDLALFRGLFTRTEAMAVP